MKRFAVGLLIAVLSIVALAGIAMAGGSGSPSSQEGDATAQQGWLGISIANVNERIQDHFQLTVDSGVVVIGVAPEGPAHAAGLQAGDVIQAINGAPVETADQVTDAIQALSPGTVVTLAVLRGAEQMSVEATLGARPEPPVPSYLRQLLGQGLPGNLLHAEYEVLGPDGAVISVGLTLGEVQSATEAGLLTIVRKDDQVAEFQTTADTRVIVGGHPINLVGLKEGTPVLVVEKDDAVVVVIGWPGDLLRPAKPLRENLRRHQYQLRRDMPSLQAPHTGAIPGFNPEALRERLGNLTLPGPEMQERLRKAVEQWRGADMAPIIQSETPGQDQTF